MAGISQTSATGGNPPVEEINVRGIVPLLAPDPGDGGALDTTRSCVTELATGAVGETRTLADPIFKGQEIILVFVVDGGGDCVITAASPINQNGDTIMTFSDVGESIILMGHYNATDGWEWVQTSLANGVALS